LRTFFNTFSTSTTLSMISMNSLLLWINFLTSCQWKIFAECTSLCVVLLVQALGFLPSFMHISCVVLLPYHVTFSVLYFVLSIRGPIAAFALLPVVGWFLPLKLLCKHSNLGRWRGEFH
jgi:hypothetical protein